MENYTKTETKVKSLMTDDHFFFGDKLYRITRLDPPTKWQPDVHIHATLVKEDGQLSRKIWIGVFALPKTKITIYTRG